MSSMEYPSHQEIACQQVLVDNASVFSIQRTLLPASIMGTLSAEILLARYLAYIRSCTLSIIRPLVSHTGIEYRLFHTRWSLISFLPPEVEADSVTLRICGGLLVQSGKCDSGEFRFDITPAAGGVLASLKLSGYFPVILGAAPPSWLRFWLYRLTQAAVHRLITIHFLARLHKYLTGSKAAVRVVNISICDGRPV